MAKTKLGINIDHVATLRQARFTVYPDPATAALVAQKAGCDSIVAHLRKDQRHIQKEDVFLIKDLINIPFNLEMSTAASIVSVAEQLKPDQATLVPENRKELTTEGGIDLIKSYKKVEKAIKRLKKKKIKVSLFIDPVKKQVKLAKDLGAEIVEFNTGQYSQRLSDKKQKKELERIQKSALFAKEEGFFVAAGHGLDYENIKKIANVGEIQEFNIGHSIICESIFLGLAPAVKEMIARL
ncbi:MAG: pyridoxine 5'-phosphate synthase [Candidatus Omnitrophica bacterium]|nr:pyridoxine 5'-phosphate synthase [Candidatus Omnitrophota bacterium]